MVTCLEIICRIYNKGSAFFKGTILFKTGRCLSWKENRLIDKPDEIERYESFMGQSNTPT